MTNDMEAGSSQSLSGVLDAIIVHCPNHSFMQTCSIHTYILVINVEIYEQQRPNKNGNSNIKTNVKNLL